MITYIYYIYIYKLNSFAIQQNSARQGTLSLCSLSLFLPLLYIYIYRIPCLAKFRSVAKELTLFILCPKTNQLFSTSKRLFQTS